MVEFVMASDLNTEAHLDCDEPVEHTFIPVQRQQQRVVSDQRARHGSNSHFSILFSCQKQDPTLAS